MCERTGDWLVQEARSHTFQLQEEVAVMVLYSAPLRARGSTCLFR
jgi:hypothetical protein